MQKFLRQLTLGAAFVGFTLGAAHAGGARVRGEVIDIKADVYTVLAASGQEIDVTMPDPMVLVYTDIALSDVADGAYVSVPSVALANDAWRALGVTVFPEPMRGMNEGFADWDLTSDSKMTNATLSQLVSRGGEGVLTLQYGDEKQTVVLAPNAPVTTFAPDPARKLAKGDLVVIFAEETQGSFSGKFVGVHANGTLPPV